MTRPNPKTATTYADQVALLQSRGMEILDAAQAEFYLQHLNYYRLAAYWLPFEADHATHAFKPGTTFPDVLTVYICDRELRLLVLDAIERVEVSLRSQWAYQLAHRHSPHAHLDPGLARRRDRWDRDIESMRREVSRSDEAFIEHHRVNYAERLPPVWAVCEVISLGLLSRLYGNLGPTGTRTAISRVYDLDDGVLESWLHHLAYVRNVCAHHARLWNRVFTIAPMVPRSKPRALVGQLTGRRARVGNTLALLLHLMDIVSPGHSWRRRLRKFLAEHPAQLYAMGLHPNWQAQAIWNETTGAIL